MKRREAVSLLAAVYVSIGFRNRKNGLLSALQLLFYEQLRRGPGNWEFKKITNEMISHCQTESCHLFGSLYFM